MKPTEAMDRNRARPAPPQMFQTPRGPDGRLRAGRWDRGMTFGEKVKDGVPTTFSIETFGQMIDNWKRRGEKLSYCYNHQSAYASENGQPAPALAYANAIAVVKDDTVERFEKLLISTASAPDINELRRQVMELATDENPQPSPDGCWFYRYEHTALGEALLPTFAYLSPMFVPDGADEEGNEVGYALFDLAATNTAFQAGCVINFDRATGKATMSIDPTKMHVSPSQLQIDDVICSVEGIEIGTVAAKGVDRVLVNLPGGEAKWFTGRDLANLFKKEGAAAPQETTMAKTLLATFAAQLKIDGTNKKKVRAFYSRKVRQATSALRVLEARRFVTKMGRKFEGDEAKEFEDDAAEMKRFEEEGPAAEPDKGASAMACKLEEMAKHYEDSYEKDDDEEGDEPHHVVMRKLAKKFRRLAAMDAEPVDPQAMDVDPSNKEQNAAVHLKTGNVHDEGGRHERFETDDEAKVLMARRLGLTGAPTLRDIARAFEAKTAPLTEVADLKTQVQTLSQKLEHRDLTDKKAAARLFAQVAVDQGRTTKEKVASVESAYVEGGEKKAEDLLFAKGTFTALRRYADTTGDPINKDKRPQEYAQDTPDEISAKYVAKTHEIAAKEKISFGAASARVKAHAPQLYQAYAATRRR